MHKYCAEAAPEQKNMTKNDVVIICGDFGGIWDTDKNSAFEGHWLKWLDEKPFTTLFIDGNHENFDRLNSEFETVSVFGGKAHKIRSSIYHLLRGEVFEIEGIKFFAFGGARSHDIKDGIISRDDFDNEIEFRNTIRRWKKLEKEFRVAHEKWWPQELPDDNEIAHAEETLKKFNYSVDHVITHCAPQSISDKILAEPIEPDKLTLYFDKLLPRLKFKNWFFGHYHGDKKVDDRFILIYKKIVRIE